MVRVIFSDTKRLFLHFILFLFAKGDIIKDNIDIINTKQDTYRKVVKNNDSEFFKGLR